MKSIFFIAIIWLFLAIISALSFGALVPQNWAGAIALLIFGPPIYIICEAIGDWLWSTWPFRKISESPSKSIRIVGSVVMGFILLFGVFAISTYISASHGI
jgi:hypothetical protein